MNRAPLLRHIARTMTAWPEPGGNISPASPDPDREWRFTRSYMGAWYLVPRTGTGLTGCISWSDWRAARKGSPTIEPQNYAEDSDAESALSQAMSMPSKYHVRLNGAWCDVYDVLLAFGVTNPADQHAIKKMLMPGKRGVKSGIQDRREAIQSLHRAIELEDGE